MFKDSTALEIFKLSKDPWDIIQS
jgi:hypothetical protein